MNKLILLACTAIAFTGCKKCDDETITVTEPDKTKTFMVTVQNVSTTSTLQPGAMILGMPDRTAPISHGVWAIFNSNSANLFTLDAAADEGTARIAEDGFTFVKTNSLNNTSSIYTNGEFTAPGGPANNEALFTGESSMFMIKAKPGQMLQFQSMFVQSNDWFYSFSGAGLDLFNGETPISGDVTSSIKLYDAGTELDEAPGLGTTQKLDQGPTETNIGPADPVNQIKEAMARHNGSLTIPATSSVIRVTITPQ